RSGPSMAPKAILLNISWGGPLHYCHKIRQRHPTHGCHWACRKSLYPILGYYSIRCVSPNPIRRLRKALQIREELARKEWICSFTSEEAFSMLCPVTSPPQRRQNSHRTLKERPVIFY